MSVGESVYLRLEGFAPSWRQGVVVSVGEDKILQLAVRVTTQESENQAGLLTSFTVEGNQFILVEGGLTRLRATCTQPHRALEVDPVAVVSAALDVLKD